MWDRGLLPSHPLSPKPSGPSGQGWACPHLAIFGAQTASQMLTLSGQGPPPFQQMGGSQEATIGQASVICSQQLCSRGLQSWQSPFPPRALAVTFQVGKCPLSQGSPGPLSPPAQKPNAVHGHTVWSVRTLVLNFELVSGLQKGRDFM